jgi:CheY-like chemotaxis protein
MIFVNKCGMTHDGSSSPHKHLPFQVLLADDDNDDRFFFARALSELPIPTQLSTIEDGEQLMNYLTENHNMLPDIVFVDLNMPKKNGIECLSEIKSTEKLKLLPVVIISTSVLDDVADLIYEGGAHYYVRKTNVADLKKSLLHVLTLLVKNKFFRPARNKFVLSLVGV